MISINSRERVLVKYLSVILASLFISSCGSSSSDESSPTTIATTSDLIESPEKLLIVQQAPSDSTEANTLYDLYIVNSEKPEAPLKLNDLPFNYYITDSFYSEHTQKNESAIVWFEEQRLYGASVTQLTPIEFDSANVNSPFCSLDYYSNYYQSDKYLSRVLVTAGEDNDCNNESDNELFSIEATPGGKLTLITPSIYDEIRGLWFFIKNGEEEELYKLYNMPSGGMDIINPKTGELIASYGFQFPNGDIFFANDKVYILTNLKLYSFRLSELNSNSFELASSSIDLSESLTDYTFLGGSAIGFDSFFLGFEGYDDRKAEYVFLEKNQEIKQVNLLSGNVSLLSTFPKNTYLSQLRFVEGSNQAFHKHNKEVRAVNLDEGTIRVLHQYDVNHTGISIYKRQMTFTEFEEENKPIATHIIDIDDGVVWSKNNTDIEYGYWNNYEAPNIILLNTQASDENNFESSLVLFDRDTLSVIRQLGSAPVDRFDLRFSGNYIFATDSSRKILFRFDADKENSIKQVAEFDSGLEW